MPLRRWRRSLGRTALVAIADVGGQVGASHPAGACFGCGVLHPVATDDPSRGSRPRTRRRCVAGVGSPSPRAGQLVYAQQLGVATSATIRSTIDGRVRLGTHSRQELLDQRHHLLR
jgi:hypothetical protein